METVESPLEVLSRAATMLQESEDASNTDEIPKDEDPSRNSPVSKWKRERRSRLPPEYSRKENNQQQRRERRSATPPEGGESPIDMTVKQRGLPPSYAQAINNLGNRSTYRTPPPPPPQQPATANRDDIPAGISMCDPIIDEHFRRSLGNNYESLFVNNNSKQTAPNPSKPPPLYENSVKDLMDNTGVSVDDHFAKALGDTWYKLNQKNRDIKSDSSSDTHNLLSI